MQPTADGSRFNMSMLCSQSCNFVSSCSLHVKKPHITELFSPPAPPSDRALLSFLCLAIPDPCAPALPSPARTKKAACLQVPSLRLALKRISSTHPNRFRSWSVFHLDFCQSSEALARLVVLMFPMLKLSWGNCLIWEIPSSHLVFTG